MCSSNILLYIFKILLSGICYYTQFLQLSIHINVPSKWENMYNQILQKHTDKFTIIMPVLIIFYSWLWISFIQYLKVVFFLIV